MFAASAFRKLSSIYVFSYFPFGFEGRIWDLIVSVPDHCLSFYFAILQLFFHQFPKFKSCFIYRGPTPNLSGITNVPKDFTNATFLRPAFG